MTEAALIAWFTGHPFTRNVCVAVVGSVAASIKHDRAAFLTARATDPAAVFKWSVALRTYVQGGGLAGATIVGAEVLHVLGIA